MPRHTDSKDFQTHAAEMHGFWSARSAFPPALENAFQAEMDAVRERRTLKTGLAAVLLYAAFAISDRNMVPDIYRQAWAVRFLLVIPLMLATSLFVYRIRSAVLREAVLSATIILSGSSLAWIASMSRHPNAAHYISGVTLIILFGNIVLNLRLRSALVSSLLMMAIYGWLLSQAETIAMAARFNNWLFCMSAVAISLIASYRIDQDQRRAYLARVREEERNKELSRANDMLEKLSSEDGLTQLANRRAFDRRLSAEWSRARREGQPLALVMIDIDYFKNFNDRYGHPAGDDCLQQVARVLEAHTRRPADMAARVGGEEFAVLLPATGSGAAAHIAEQMRAAIAGLGIAHQRSGIAAHVTASFGVAAMVPDGQQEPGALLTAADACLYQAKQGGRDRVAASPEAVAA
ncbi:MAG TPA: diguanylate cyclase [Noviherbaspirillum sp.]|jgi:diguanylate cyclase (GGDEF)-like protein|uniref:GGDEF domain-containing protein n=1 Tax=Noviherbaspirillum sp. TaxID=1926288 RepID=UPI002F9540C9